MLIYFAKQNSNTTTAMVCDFPDKNVTIVCIANTQHTKFLLSDTEHDHIQDQDQITLCMFAMLLPEWINAVAFEAMNVSSREVRSSHRVKK